MAGYTGTGACCYSHSHGIESILRVLFLLWLYQTYGKAQHTFWNMLNGAKILLFTGLLLPLG